MMFSRTFIVVGAMLLSSASQVVAIPTIADAVRAIAARDEIIALVTRGTHTYKCEGTVLYSASKTTAIGATHWTKVIDCSIGTNLKGKKMTCSASSGKCV